MYHEINSDWWGIVRGTRFRCTQCGACCEKPGHVYFSRDEVKPIAQYLGTTPRRFLRKYAKKLPNGDGYELRMTPQGHCPFYLTDENSCGVHPAKFVQCRTYPFWPEHVENPGAWAEARRECEGIGKGPKVLKRDARACLQESAGV